MASSLPTPLRIGLVTVSDRASQGIYEDRGGPAMEAYLNEHLNAEWTPSRRLIPDEPDVLEAALRSLCDEEQCHLVLTTGGTGPAPRDITPDVTEQLCQRLLPGFGEAMRMGSLPTVPTAILARQVAGIRGSTLIVNLPGKPAAIAECLDLVFPAIPHALRLIHGG